MSTVIDALLAGENPGAPSTGEGSKKVYSVGQYNRAVERRMKEFPKIWVKGVITQLQVRGKVVYLTLAEFEEGDARPKATLDVILFTGQYESYNARFAQLPTPFQLRPELKVSFLLEAAFYVPSGRFQTRVLDVDEAFTLGELALTRQKILDALKRDGLLDLNKRLFLSPVPLRVGLVSSRGSAAYQDFTTVLLGSGFSFDIVFAEARMQGPATETTVCEAILRLSRAPLDVICVVRGGGSKTDLVFFDSEKICRAIANCPVPVLTGIGHEIDRSLADVVAHADLLTPTDCAKFLQNRVATAWQRLADQSSQLREAWTALHREEAHNVSALASRLSAVWESRRRLEARRQADLARGLSAASGRELRGAREKLRVNRVGLSRGPGKLARLEHERFSHRADSVRRAWRAARTEEARRQVRIASLLGAGARRALEAAEAHLARGRTGLARGPRKLLAAFREALQGHGRALAFADPAALARRGYARVTDPKGKSLTAASALKAGESLRIRFADGDVRARVESIEMTEAPEGSPAKNDKESP
jgi:exodeoxyribonuclease VII large subunit